MSAADSDDIGRQLRRFKKGSYYTIGGAAEEVGSPPRSYPMLEAMPVNKSYSTPAGPIFFLMDVLYWGVWLAPFIVGTIVVLARS